MSGHRCSGGYDLPPDGSYCRHCGALPSEGCRKLLNVTLRTGDTANTPAEAVEADHTAADAAYYARLLLRLRDRLHLIAEDAADEGGRVYFGSTNDADDLRDIARDLDNVRWDRVMRGAEKRDYIAEARALNDTIATLTAQRDALAEALRGLSFAAQTSGGVAGRDEGLVEAIGKAEVALAAAGRR